MPRGYTSRHIQSRGGKAPLLYYSAEASKQYSETPLEHDSDDEARLQDLRQRWSTGTWRQADQQQWNEITTRKEEREELRQEPLRQELDNYFSNLDNLSPLPPPLPKKSEWLDIKNPKDYPNAEVRPFFAACEEGSLEVVKRWVLEGKDKLLQVGVQDGLACAARNKRVDIVRYLLDEGGAILDCSVVEGACMNRSLALFEQCVRRGYHPNQQVPSNAGHFGVALNHCLDSEEVTLFLLRHGADPNLAPFQDGRRSCWGSRAVPPMDLTCGLALDRAVEDGCNLAVVEGLLEHGANPGYSRPLHGVVRRRRKQTANLVTEGGQTTTKETQSEDKGDWHILMSLLIKHGADVNSKTRYSGTPLAYAIKFGMWDIVEFLLANGADPKMKNLVSGEDAFQIAAKSVGIPWELSEALEHYLRYLTSSSSAVQVQETTVLPEVVHQNPLVQVLQKAKVGKGGKEQNRT
ncbi:ankyrin repeat-containing domain protein [Xylaria sp. FL0064]|nr:ankyrin repeat-containing domain protein [Xylaria sp. FL0064]